MFSLLCTGTETYSDLLVRWLCHLSVESRGPRQSILASTFPKLTLHMSMSWFVVIVRHDTVRHCSPLAKPRMRTKYVRWIVRHAVILHERSVHIGWNRLASVDWRKLCNDGHLCDAGLANLDRVLQGNKYVDGRVEASCYTRLLLIGVECGRGVVWWYRVSLSGGLERRWRWLAGVVCAKRVVVFL